MLLELDDDGDDEEEDGIDDAVLLELGLLELELELLELELLLELLDEDDDELELGMLGMLDCDDCEELVDSQPASTSARALSPSNCFTTGIFIMNSPEQHFVKPYIFRQLTSPSIRLPDRISYSFIAQLMLCT